MLDTFLTTLEVSDVLLLLGFAASLYFAIVFTFGRPRRWFADPLGWVMFISAWALVSLFILIVYATVFDERLAESFRVLIGAAVLAGLIGKIYNLHRLRRRPRVSDEQRISQ
jgi:hypothetical protein